MFKMSGVKTRKFSPKMKSVVISLNEWCSLKVYKNVMKILFDFYIIKFHELFI
jgi:hypothetical protein